MIKLNGSVRSVSFSHDSKYIANGGVGFFSVTNTITGTKVYIQKYDGDVNSVSFSPDGQQILIGTSNGYLRIIDLNQVKSISISINMMVSPQ